MFGAVIGDYIGSVYERDNVKTKDFPLFSEYSCFTDDSVMTIAVASAMIRHKRDNADFHQALVEEMQGFGQRYPNAGYGGMFWRWIWAKRPKPYGSYGNGSAMRASPCGLIATSLEEALDLAKQSAEVTHNHPEGIKGAQAAAAAVYFAKTGSGKADIKEYISENFYDISRSLDEIRPTYAFDVSCQGSVPEAIISFLESTSFDDTIRNAISIGGDSNTIAAIAGGIAWEYYGRNGITHDMREILERVYLPEDMMAVIEDFESICAQN